MSTLLSLVIYCLGCVYTYWAAKQKFKQELEELRKAYDILLFVTHKQESLIEIHSKEIDYWKRKYFRLAFKSRPYV